MSSYSAEYQREITQILSDVNIATINHLVPEAVEQISTASVITRKLLKKSKPWNGGNKIEINLDYGATSPTEMESKYQAIVNQNIDSLEKIYLDSYWINDNVVIPWLDMMKNKGKAKILSLSKTKLKAMTRGMKLKFNEVLFRPMGTASPAQMPSIYDWTMQTSTSTALGGLTPAMTAGLFKWTPEVFDYSSVSSGSLVYKNLYDKTHDYFIINMIRDLISAIVEQTDEMPDLGFMPQYIWDAWDIYLTNNQQGSEGVKSYDGGYESIKFRGVNFYPERYAIGGLKNPAATSVITVINTEFLGFHHLPAVNNSFTPWKMLEESKIYRSEMDWAGTFGCTRRDVHGSIILPFAEHTS